MNNLTKDRSTLLIILVVLVVCIIGLLGGLNIVWQVIREPVRVTLKDISSLINSNNIDYNFNVPQSSSSSSVSNSAQSSAQSSSSSVSNQQSSSSSFQAITTIQPSKKDDPIQLVALKDRTIDYDFTVAPKPYVPVDTSIAYFPDAIVDTSNLIENPDAPKGNITIQIPKIGVNSRVLQGLDSASLLEQGFWVYPASNDLGKGEVLMLCHRRYWGPYSPNSCWFLDRVAKDDEIVINYNGNIMRYIVVGTNIFGSEDPLIYSTSSKDDVIKISTCTPLGSSANRLVVLAKRVKD